ncbi:MAG: DEAD/DEAH box helicase family protein [Methylocella sp.]
MNRFPGLIRKNGMPLDRAREAAAEAGYLGAHIDHAMAETTISDLKDAMDRHPTYSVHDLDRVLERDSHAANAAQAEREVDDNRRAIHDGFREYAVAQEEPDHDLVDAAAHIMQNEGKSWDDALEAAAVRSIDDLPEAREAIDAEGASIPWRKFDEPATPTAPESGKGAAPTVQPSEKPATEGAIQGGGVKPADGGKNPPRAEGQSGKAPQVDPKDEFREIGHNADGNLIREDGNGVRSYFYRGFWHSESVGLQRTPAGWKHVRPTMHDAEYEPVAANTSPATEAGAEGKPQTVIPGAERISDADLAQREAEKPLAPKVPQKDAGGMFDEANTAPQLFDKPAKASKSEPEKDLTNAIGDSLRTDAPAIPEGQQPIDAGRPPEVGPTGGLLADGGRASNGPLRHPDSADSQQPEPADRPAGKAKRSPKRPAGSGGDSSGGDSVRTAAERGRLEAAQSLADRAKRNYLIDPEADQIGVGGPRAKFRANIEAIRTVHQVLAEAREPTLAEKQALVRYTGWGSLSQKAFDQDREYKAERAELKELLTPEEYAAARASTTNAHYTSVPVIQGIWKAVESLGFMGGRALEPAAGVGHFIGLTPESARNVTAWTASELDPTSGAIAKMLYGGADVNVTGFQDLKRPDDYFDLAISNVPFGAYGIRDAKYGLPNLPIHDYFFVRSLDKVRAGGMVAFITSRYTMDKEMSRARKMINQRADFMGAIRLPGGKKGAFAGNAGTEVTTDIIFLRKRANGQSPAENAPSWNDVTDIRIGDGTARINKYFDEHPNIVLGEHVLSGSMYRANEYGVASEDISNIANQIASAASTIPRDLRMVPRSIEARTPKQTTEAAETTGKVKEGGFFEKDGKIFRVLNGVGQETSLKGEDVAKVASLSRMRDIFNDLVSSQASGKTEANAHLREKLSAEYEAFVKKHGPISREVVTVTKRLNKAGEPVIVTSMPNFKAFRPDPDAYKVLSLENYDAETDKARKTALFERDIVSAPVERMISGPSDAMMASLDARGGVDEYYIADALKIPVEQVEAALGDVAYRDPAGGKLATSDDYLSGDVVQKLENAEAAAKDDPRFARNVEALKKVQPEPLTSVDIKAQIGAPWIPDDVYKQFLEEHLGADGSTVRRNPVTAEWNIGVAGASTEAYAKYATNRVDLPQIVDAAMNMRRITVTDKHSDGTSSVNDAATKEANIKVADLKDAFAGNDETGAEGWVWKNDANRDRLEAIYNRQYNSTVNRKFDGQHQTFPGMTRMAAQSDGTIVPFDLRAHQKNAVWRIVQNGNTLLDHVVGAGKTYTMVAASMEMRRLGLVRKPMHIIPNHMLEQYSREFLQAYPTADILVAEKDEMTRDARRAFAGKVATGNWDAIVITHDAFGRIKTSEEWQASYIDKQMEQLEEIIGQMHADKNDKKTVKQVETAKNKLEARKKALLNIERKDGGVTFEELGVDHIFLDEAHLFKNLAFATKMTRVKGLSQAASQRAEDLYQKIQWLEQNKPGRSATFASGTPISNTLAEMFTMQRYLQENRLRQLGIDKFDNWASTFGQTVDSMELSPDGRTYQPVTSFSKFVNIPELVSIYSEIADTQTADMLNLPRPELAKNESGQPGIRIVQAEPTEEEERLIDGFVSRAANLKGVRPGKGSDNMLKVVSDGRKVATDARLYNPDLPFNPNGKVARAIDKITKIYKEGEGSDKVNKLQLVFLDMGVPQTRAATKKPKADQVDEGATDEEDAGEPLETARINLYEDMAKRLVERGIPRNEIAFIHDAKDDQAKGRLFAKARSGETRVLFGSTGKMGVGTNVQRLMTALHHIDAPWKPAEVSQRDGRGLRQGNMNKELQLYRYVTQRSFDAFMWQKLDTKAKFIGQIISGAKGVRSAEDIDNPLPEAAEMKAAATGDMRILEQAELTRKVNQLTAQRRSFESTQSRLSGSIKFLKSRLLHSASQIESAKTEAAKVQDVSGDNFKINLSGVKGGEQTSREAAGAAVKKYFVEMERSFMNSQDARIGNYAGLEISARAQRVFNESNYGVRIQPFIRWEGGEVQSRESVFIDKDANLDGFTRRLDTMISEIKRRPAVLQEGIARDKADLAQSEGAMKDSTWPREADYRSTVEKLSALNKALAEKGKPAEQPKVAVNMTPAPKPESEPDSVDAVRRQLSIAQDRINAQVLDIQRSTTMSGEEKDAQIESLNAKAVSMNEVAARRIAAFMNKP